MKPDFETSDFNFVLALIPFQILTYINNNKVKPSNRFRREKVFKPIAAVIIWLQALAKS